MNLMMKNEINSKTILRRTAKYRIYTRFRRTNQYCKSKLGKEIQLNRKEVNEEIVADVVAMITGVPKAYCKEITNDLLQWKKLNEQVIGQAEAINKISKAIRRNKIGLKDPNKPIGVFVFLGLRVGKTYLAKYWLNIC